MARPMPAEKRRDIREAIQTGMTSEDIQKLLSTSAGSVIKIKREMGLPIRQVNQIHRRGKVQAVAQPPEGDPPSNHTYAEQQPAPINPISPEDYVAAFEARVLEFRQLLAAKDATIERLEREYAKLRDEYAQTVFRQQNWQGPTSTMAQSLGNGG